MMRAHTVIPALLLTVLAGCAHRADQRGTLGSLHQVQPDTKEVPVDQGLDRAVQSYRDFLQQAPESKQAPEAMRRLADLNIEKQFGIHGDGKLVELPASQAVPQPAAGAAVTGVAATQPAGSAKGAQAAQLRAPAVTKIGAQATARSRPRAADAGSSEPSERDLEQRAASPQVIPPATGMAPLALPGGEDADRERAGPLEAIKLYDELLAKYPHYAFRDQVLYQKARAYDELGQTEAALKVMEQLASEYPSSHYADEVQFRRAERFFIVRKYREAESAYTAIVTNGPGSEYYEPALYKLGWTLYKQQLFPEALGRYFAFLDYKVKSGYDFDAKHTEAEQRRVEDTFQVVSLSFSNIGGPDVIGSYFAANGHRAYEDRVYRYLAEFYLVKLRYQDAATVYKSFVALYPYHQASPHFSMRVVEIYEKGSFPQLVLVAKKDFAATYGLREEYWQHVDVNKSPEVLSYLKSNLQDLANYYHAQYQDPKQREQQPASYAEATRWYREFLSSFHDDRQAPQLNYQLADLMLENHDYPAAAREYEITAYDYPPHAKSAAAGYAAIYAHREYLKVAGAEAKDAARRDTINSSIRFADTFPQHEQAAVVLAAAAQDAYEMKDLALARDTARHLIEKFPNATASVRRDAWLVIGHATFGLAAYADAEQAYGRVLEATPREDAAHAGLVENLAASIYKQGEQANQAGDYRTAANQFVRVKQVAPTSKICAAAEYDAGAALLRLKDWTAAAQILEEFRRSFPEHELQKDATKQIAYAYQQSGQLAQSASEYERVAQESPNPQLRAEALLQAGDLYGQAKDADRALQTYSRYVEQFPKPLEAAIETRSKIAEIWHAKGDQDRYHHELAEIVGADAAAGSERTDRTRNLAGRAALVLTEPVYAQFASLKLTQPFEKSLQEKQRGLEAATKAFGALVDYQVGEVTAAATFYIAESYGNFSQALRDSERPPDLGGDALTEYERQLAEAARPLEEKAVAVHEKNLELMRRGLDNPWTQKSLDRLAALKPATYARLEISSGFLGSLERYVYRPPARAVESTAGTATVPPAPLAPGAGTPAQAAAVSPPTAPTAGGGNAITR
ncbi:MAG TPA: tetratricopeptide repeat protein [Steroidobacteraceae bacterium]|nr:tetratricopeptide repeat protein [Steroidobacteraceae bacterium]